VIWPLASYVEQATPLVVADQFVCAGCGEIRSEAGAIGSWPMIDRRMLNYLVCWECAVSSLDQAKYSELLDRIERYVERLEDLN